MNTKAWHRFLVLAALIAAQGCGSREKEVTWKEEVRLSTHEIVGVERSQSYRRVAEPGAGAGWLFDYARLKAKLPGVEKEIAWEGPAQPLVLDLDQNGRIHLLVTMESSRSLREYKVPEGVWYIAFRFEGGTWTRIGLDQFPIDLRPNLLASVHRLFITEQEPSGGLVRLSQKETMDARPTLAEHYRKLVNLK